MIYILDHIKFILTYSRCQCFYKYQWKLFCRLKDFEHHTFSPKHHHFLLTNIAMNFSYPPIVFFLYSFINFFPYLVCGHEQLLPPLGHRLCIVYFQSGIGISVQNLENDGASHCHLSSHSYDARFGSNDLFSINTC